MGGETLGAGQLGLVGDIGGTNARFALVEFEGGAPRLIEPTTYKVAEHGASQDAIADYLAKAGARRPVAAVVAVAGPIRDGAVHFTNSPWTLSEDGLRQIGGLGAARLINDFTAQALAAPRLGPKDLRQIGPLPTASEGDLAILGPGTGFGAAGMVRRHGVNTPLATEGGHIGFAPADDLEIEILRILIARFGRCSIERILSGPGLEDLHVILARIDGRSLDEIPARQITEGAQAGDLACRATLDRFCAILGAAAGDLALALGARGGVLVAGGVAPRIVDHLAGSPFRARFEAKGRLSDYARAIPTHVVMNPHTALIGAAMAMTPAGQASVG